jgi:hypothetical protein
MLLVGQYAAAEGCDTFAKGIWNPAARKMTYSTHTLGAEPPSRRDALLARQAQVLIAAESKRGRPLEVPIDALNRLQQAGDQIGPYDARERRNFANPLLMSPEGVDKLRQRALISRLANLVQTAPDKEG